MSRLNIKVNGEWLDVPDKVQLKYRWTNNMFFNRSKQRERSFEMTLPSTGTNNRVLKYLNQIGTHRSMPTSFDCQVYDDTMFIMNATLRVRSTTDSYKAYVLGEWGTLEELFGDKMVDELDWTVTTPSLDEADVLAGSYPEYPFWYPAVYWFECNTEPNQAPELLEYHGLYNYLYTALATGQRRGPARSAPYLLHLIEGICLASDIRMIDSGLFMTDEELRSLIMLSTGTVTELSAAAHIGYLPRMKVVDFFTSIEKMFCCTFLLDARSKRLKVVFHRETALRTDLLDWTEKLASDIGRNWEGNITGFRFSWSNDFIRKFNTINFESEQIHSVFAIIDVPELVLWGEKSYRYLACNSLFGNRKQNGVTTMLVTDYVGNIQSAADYVVMGEYDTWQDRPSPGISPYLEPGTIIYIKSRKSYYIRTIQSRWMYFFHRFEGVVTGLDEQEEITPDISPALMDIMGPRLKDGPLEVDPMLLDDTWRLPCVKNMAFTSNKKGDGSSRQVLPMLAFKREIVESIDYDISRDNVETYNFEYPYASSDEFDPEGNDAYNYSLHWDGPKGLFETWWSDWAEVLRNGQELEAMLNLTHTDIAKLDMSRPIYISGAKCFIKEIEIVIPMKGPTRVKFIRV